MPVLFSSAQGNNILKSNISYTYTISLWVHHHQRWSLQNAAGSLSFHSQKKYMAFGCILAHYLMSEQVLWFTVMFLTVMNFNVQLSETIDEDSYKVMSSWWTSIVLSVRKSSEFIVRYWKIRVTSTDMQSARFGFQRCLSTSHSSPRQIKGSVSRNNSTPSKHCFGIVVALNIFLESSQNS